MRESSALPPLPSLVAPGAQPIRTTTGMLGAFLGTNWLAGSVRWGFTRRRGQTAQRKFQRVSCRETHCPERVPNSLSRILTHTLRRARNAFRKTRFFFLEWQPDKQASRNGRSIEYPPFLIGSNAYAPKAPETQQKEYKLYIFFCQPSLANSFASSSLREMTREIPSPLMVTPYKIPARCMVWRLCVTMIS